MIPKDTHSPRSVKHYRLSLRLLRRIAMKRSPKEIGPPDPPWPFRSDSTARAAFLGAHSYSLGSNSPFWAVKPQADAAPAQPEASVRRPSRNSYLLESATEDDEVRSLFLLLILLQGVRYVNHIIVWGGRIFASRKFRFLKFFRKNLQNFGELQRNSAFSRKPVKIREIFMKICENRD